MPQYTLKLPDLGEGVVESEIVEWSVKVGDQVNEDDPIGDVMTDKATVEVTSPVTGVVVSLAGKEGDVIAVGSPLITFECEVLTNDTSEENTNPDSPSTKERAEDDHSMVSPQPELKAVGVTQGAPSLTISSNQTSLNVRALAAPSVRKKALENNIDINAVPGSGPAGRISYDDLDNFIAAGGELALKYTQQTSDSNKKSAATNDVKLLGLRRVIAEKMQHSKQTIPHYSYIEEVDVTELEALRKTLNIQRLGEGKKLTILPFIIQALIRVLPDFPHCNARHNTESGVTEQYDAVHIGMATMTDDGLKVPVIRHAESLDIWQQAAEISRLATAARENNAQPQELSGSTITITSLGAIGGIASTPIVNHPETAIIGVNKMQQRAVVVDDKIIVRRMMNLSASFDHRIVDGYDGAQLIQAIKKLLEQPALLFI